MSNTHIPLSQKAFDFSVVYIVYVQSLYYTGRSTHFLVRYLVCKSVYKLTNFTFTAEKFVCR